MGDPTSRKWQLWAAAAAATLVLLSVLFRLDAIRCDYWRSRLERTGAASAAHELTGMGECGRRSLVEVLAGAESPRARACAAEALAWLDPTPEVLAQLERAASDPDEDVRASARGALVDLGGAPPATGNDEDATESPEPGPGPLPAPNGGTE